MGLQNRRLAFSLLSFFSFSSQNRTLFERVYYVLRENT